MPLLQSSDVFADARPALEPIAICGMSCRTPGQGTSPSALWQMLLEKRAGNTTKVPKSRFNIDAHFHENVDRPGSFPVPGGYFLDGAPEDFDPTFFNMTPVEAMWLDPQQRRMLEVCYEAIESAGLTLDSIAGSNTGVFAASFTADYQQMTFKDPDFRHNYAATGVDTGIISARVGNIFDLRGPTSLINTACSSSVYAVHNACNSLRSRDCDSAIVGGVNMILTVDQHMNTAKLGIMSPTSFCHTFDESADGYGRAEGAGALYLKRLEDAVRDGDTIRAVIRSSAINSNGRVPGYGITFPNVDGQEQVIRQAYKHAALDPSDTAVFEVHGTGTPVGDPIEVRAVSRAMNDTRSKDKPLLITATKPNIGHSEAASGIFAIIKAVMMVETGLVPGIAGLKKLNPNIHENEWNVQINRDLSEWPAGLSSRRASLSSFGYGGQNGHVLVENVEALVPDYRHGAPKSQVGYDHSSTTPLLITMSAHDITTLSRNIQAYASVADQFYLADLAHTLNTKRTTFQQRAFAVAKEPTVSQDLVMENFKLGSGSIQDLAFIFTGQGAQWAGVGKEAIATFPVFRETIRKLDRVLRRLAHAPDFSLEEQLSISAESSRIGDPDVAQSTLAAVQIAVVDLLDSWGISPRAAIGHSSGEVAAAYAAGLVSAPEAIVAAYYRGYSLVRYAQKGGSMLAVGKGADDLAAYRDHLDAAIVVACENSPSSVTLSGPVEAIHAARDLFASENVFARELRTGMAYHSPFMQSAAGPMAVLISDALERLDGVDRQWRYPERTMVSTVTNQRLRRADVVPTYWTSNLVSPVLFNTGLQALVSEESFEGIDGFLEIGPHSALAGPFKQICKGNGFSAFTYIPTIVRTDGNSATSLLKTAGELYLASYPVDLVQVNLRPLGASHLGGPANDHQKPRSSRPLALVDLPPYQWNYEKVFWTEPRASAEYRQLTHARHDLLGRRILGLSDHSIAWRNVLRIKDIPWLVDHKLGGSIMFPAAGHLAVAIEAVRQHCELTNVVDVVGATVRDLKLKTALVIPETDGGIEIQVRLTEQTATAGKNNTPAYSFAVESWSDGSGWVVHSEGFISPTSSNSTALSATHPVDMDALTQRHSGKRWNESFRRVGFEYGRAFATLDKIRTHGKYQHQAAGVLPIATESGLMQGESRYMIHPSTVDGLLQLIIIAIHGGIYQDMPWGVIPVRFDEVTIRLPGDAAAGALGNAVAWLPERGERARSFVSDAKLTTAAREVVLDIKGMHSQSYEAALPPVDEATLKPKPYMGVTWRPDPVLNAASSLIHRESTVVDAVLKLVEALNHKQPLSSVLVLDTQATIDEARLLRVTTPTTTVALAGSKNNTERDDARIQRIHLHDGHLDVSALGLETREVVVFGPKEAKELIQSELVSDVKSLLRETANLLLLVLPEDAAQAHEALARSSIAAEAVSLTDFELLFALPSTRPNVECQKAIGREVDGMKDRQVDLVYSPRHSASPDGLASALESCGVHVHLRKLEDVGPNPNNPLFLYNPQGNLLSAPEQTTFEALKTIVSSGAPVTWLTSGVNEGTCPSAAMVSGFLRVVREEQKMAKVSVIDYDRDETFDSVARTVAAVLDSKAEAADDETPETEFWLHDSITHISRVLPNEELNKRTMGERGPVLLRVLSEGELLRGFPESGEIVFHSSRDFEITALAAHEVEVQVTDVLEFSKLDLQVTAEGPKLVAGVVVKVGQSIKPGLKGAHVVAYSSSAYDTLIRVPEHAIASYTPSKNDGLLAGLSRTLLALRAATGTLSEKRVLLLAPSPLLENSTARLAKAHGFDVAVLRDSSDWAEADRFIKNAGSALVVVSETFSDLSEKVWRDLPSGATFVLEGDTQKADLMSLDARPLCRGASFTVSSVKDVLKSEPYLAKTSLEAAIAIAQELDDEPETEPITMANIADASSVPNDASVLKFHYGGDQIKVAPSAFEVRFSPDDVYLLVGCLGGLGRSLTSWMMAHGAKRFAFVSRSGDDKPEAAKLVRDITEAGALPQVFRADASRTADMKSVIDAITKQGACIRGVVHAAMVLNDSMLPNMTLDRWQRTLAPKVDGARALCEALRDHEADLDFFVLTSSISAVVGQPGQTNYAAANAYLDALALARRRAGRCATSLVLPMVLGVGVVAESDDLENLIRRSGLYGADEREMLRGFAAAMSQPRPTANERGALPLDHQHAAVIMGLEPTRLARSLASDDLADASWVEANPRFASLRSYIRAASAGGAGDAGAPTNGGAFIPQLHATANKEGYAAALDMTAEHIMRKCAGVLLIPREAMARTGPKSVGGHGLDSMVGVELRNWLFKELRLTIGFQDLLAQTLTFQGLAELVLAGLGIWPGLTGAEMEAEAKRARSGIKD